MGGETLQSLALSLSEARAENERLRAALAQSDLPCAYCSLPKDEWAKCASGFPGCDRADDAMGCPELGARLSIESATRQRDEALAAEAAVLAVSPYIDSIVCYASTIDTHDGNRVAKLVNEAAAAIMARDSAGPIANDNRKEVAA